jgi:hypothetical protein
MTTIRPGGVARRLRRADDMDMRTEWLPFLTALVPAPGYGSSAATPSALPSPSSK